MINLGVFAGLAAAGVYYLPAAICSFVVSVTNNYWWNRHWTFRHLGAASRLPGDAVLLVSVIALGVNLAALSTLVALGLLKVPAQAVAIARSSPRGTSWRTSSGASDAEGSARRRAVAALVGVPSALAQTTTAPQASSTTEGEPRRDAVRAPGRARRRRQCA